jgi:hypothetical protein
VKSCSELTIKLVLYIKRARTALLYVPMPVSLLKPALCKVEVV